jgi:hypothetical protein
MEPCRKPRPVQVASVLLPGLSQFVKQAQCVAALGDRLFACTGAVNPVIHISDEDVQVGTALRFGQCLRIAVGFAVNLRVVDVVDLQPHILAGLTLDNTALDRKILVFAACFERLDERRPVFSRLCPRQAAGGAG